MDERDNLGRFLPGVSGNPKGRPPGSLDILAVIRHKLESVEGEDRRALLEQKVDEYIDSLDGPGFRDLLDRFHGKPHQTVHTDNVHEEEWIALGRDLLSGANSEAEADSGIHTEAPSETDDT